MRNTMEMTLSSHCPAEHQEDHCRQTEKLFSEYLVRRVSDQVLEQIGNASLRTAGTGTFLKAWSDRQEAWK